MIHAFCRAKNLPLAGIGLPFNKIGLDSFDLIEMRAYLESKAGFEIPDESWVRFKSLRDVEKFMESRIGNESRLFSSDDHVYNKLVKINMPEMAIGGLSESWLFRTMGDLHWQNISKGLERETDQIVDELDNRLYATFVRFKYEGQQSLKRYVENDQLDITGKLSRFGRSMFFSEARVSLPNRSCPMVVNMATTFALRNDNTRLFKGEPHLPKSCSIKSIDEFPQFSKDYQAFRKGNLGQLSLANETFVLATDPIYSTEYEINPYSDFNGVNLLYFAAYPSIADICDRRYVHDNRLKLGIVGDWADRSASIARDVFYYGNCTINDAISYKLLDFEFVHEKRVKIASALHRASDDKLICNILSVKELHG